MTTLRFASEEALRIAMASIVDAETAGKPCRAWRDADHHLLLRSEAKLEARLIEELRAKGVETTTASPPKDATVARCWAEVVGLRRTDQQIAEKVIFLAPDARTMLDTAGELLRLGCDRQELLRAGDAFLLRAIAPPFYTVARALDRVGGMRAFVAATEQVWIEVGWTHPLANALRPSEGEWLLLSPNEPWRVAPQGAWTNVYDLIDIDVPRDVHAHEPRTQELPRLRVPMRLERAASQTATTMWIVRSNAPTAAGSSEARVRSETAITTVERLIASVPDEVIESLLFAVTRGDDPTVVLRLRPQSKRSIQIDGEGYVPHMQIANLYLPVGRSLEPPLRRDVVRELLAPDADRVVWVTGEGQSLRLESIEDAAFQPLSTWVEYVIDGARELEGWVQSARFEFEDFVVVETAAPEAEESSEPKKRARDRKAPAAFEPARAEAAPAPPARGGSTKKAKAPPREEAPRSSADHAEILQALDACEAEFVAMRTPGDDPERTVLWRKMAELNARTGRQKDATLCFTRAFWSAKGDVSEAIAAWAAAEGNRDPTSILAIAQPTREDVAELAAQLALAATEQRAQGAKIDTAKAAVWLDRHDEVLDLRSLWLARSALSTMVGRDNLGLARARDRILQKLHRGLSLDRDVPTFLRVVTGARDPAQIERLASAVQALVKRFEKTKRSASTVEASPSLTLAYVLFVAACGCARLGRAEVARAYAERAKKLLDLDDPVHGFLARAYLARVEHAIDGLPAETPIPGEIAGRLNALDTFARYKVDRVRQFSSVLEPQERLDPVVAFHRGERDPRGAEFEPLRGVSDPVVLEQAIAKIMAAAKKAAPEERARLYDGIMDFFPFVPADVAVGHLETIAATIEDVAPLRRAQLLEEALMLAGHVGDQALARRIFAALRETIASLDAAATAAMAAVLGGTLRTLRRVGLRAEASELVEVMERAAQGEGTAARVARVHAASALAYTGAFERAQPVFDDTLAALRREMPVPARLELTRALARAVSHAPFDYALAALEQLTDKLNVITDSFNTNSHVCVSVVAFMESLILGYASDDLGVSESGRQWLDDDEYLIRKRIQRETTA